VGGLEAPGEGHVRQGKIQAQGIGVLHRSITFDEHEICRAFFPPCGCHSS
jgi:hypothetical protein